MKKALMPSYYMSDMDAWNLCNNVLGGLSGNPFYPVPGVPLADIQTAQNTYAASLSKADKGNSQDKAQKFELHLRNLINKEYGVEFATSNLKISFHEIDEKEICMIEIKPGLRPAYTAISEANGNKQQKFYVRSGNSSQELGLHEISDYISKRFDN
jgi:hypothetical protein